MTTNRRNPRLPLLVTLCLGSLLLAVAGTAAAEKGVIPLEVGPVIPDDASHFSTCFSKYALCISAPCSKIPGKMQFMNGVYDQAVCECEVMFGENIGATSCEERARRQHGDRIISTYSMAQTEGKGLLECDSGQTPLYTDCFNMECTIDADHPYRALCVCPILESEGTWVTRGGQCDGEACEKLWSGAPAAVNLAINQLLWDQLDFVENPPDGYGDRPPMNSCIGPPVR